MKRHYTICNCLEPDVYGYYLNLITEYTSGNFSKDQPDKYPLSLTEQGESNELFLTIKNYQRKAGLSWKVFEEPNATYVVKGPMGKGLSIKPTGAHVAFTGGTGVLVFLDLVAHLLRKVLKLLNPEEDR